MAEQTHETQVAVQQQENAASPAETREPARYLTPAVDIYETDDGLHVVADMPGVAPDALDIRLEDRVLTLQGRQAPRPQVAGELAREFELRDFFRQFSLADGFDEEKIAAELKNGVVTIALPKAAATKPRQIAVNVAS